jgi:hypothetical protein
MFSIIIIKVGSPTVAAGVFLTVTGGDGALFIMHIQLMEDDVQSAVGEVLCIMTSHSSHPHVNKSSSGHSPPTQASPSRVCPCAHSFHGIGDLLRHAVNTS